MASTASETIPFCGHTHTPAIRIPVLKPVADQNRKHLFGLVLGPPLCVCDGGRKIDRAASLQLTCSIFLRGGSGKRERARKTKTC
eukprot:scaffold2122_cov230-Skeletonema_menzelii.AAC.2